MSKLVIKDITININEEYYISLTDIARYKNNKRPKAVISNWLRNKDTIIFLGLWESFNNENFKGLEFESFRNEAGTNAFTLSTEEWINNTNAVGIIVKRGKYGGTYAHKDIAFEFTSWISAEFKLYLIVEFQRLKEKESKSIEWNVSRELSKVNYRIHTDAISSYIVPTLTDEQLRFVYASEADLLNVALFGITAKQWRDKNKEKEGNIRDYATLEQLICLANLESINSILIKEELSSEERLIKLNEIARSQIKILIDNQKKIPNKVLKNANYYKIK